MESIGAGPLRGWEGRVVAKQQDEGNRAVGEGAATPIGAKLQGKAPLQVG